MIVIDSSAILARALREPGWADIQTRISSANIVAISAGTLAETLIVSRRRGIGDAVANFLTSVAIEVVPVTADTARAVADAYDRWGKGVHPAGLNFADCFAYALAMERRCPLLFAGEDFAKTDVAAALPP